VKTEGPLEYDSLESLRRPSLVFARLLPGRTHHQFATQLVERGLPVEHVQDGPIEPGRVELVLMWGVPGWYPQAVRSLVELAPSVRPRVLLWHTEPLPLPRAAGFPVERRSARELAKIALRDKRVTDARSNLERLLRLTRYGFPDVLVVPHRASADTLAEHGIHADVVPIGSGPRHCVDLGLERNIDVLFLGELRVPRRRRLLRRLCRIGLDVTAVGDWSNPAFFGEGRARLLNRSKILLNLGRFPGQMASHRFVLGMGAGALVVSEPVYGPEPFVQSEHFVIATLDELPSVVDHFLADEPERAAIAQRGRRFVCEEVTMARSIAQLGVLVARRP